MATSFKDFQIVTPQPVRLSFPSLFKTRPKHPKTPNVLTYQATLILPPGYDVKPIVDLMQKTRTQMERKGVMSPARRLKENMSGNGNPLHKCEDKVKVNDDGTKSLPKGFEAGGHYITMHRNADFGPPTLVDRQRQPVIDEAVFYAGCWVNAHIDCFVWDNEGKWGMSFSFNGFQFVKDGDRLGGRPDVTDQFAPLEGAAPLAAGGTVSDATNLFDQ